jgi:hypothetical protein
LIALVEAATRFGYTRGSFRVLCHQFRSNPQKEFFLPPAKGRRAAVKINRVCQEVISLPKQNLSTYDISRALEHDGHNVSPANIKEEGFARLLRNRDEERPLAFALKRLRLSLSANWLSLPAGFGPALEAFSSFCRMWLQSPLVAYWKKRSFRA